MWHWAWFLTCFPPLASPRGAVPAPLLLHGGSMALTALPGTFHRKKQAQLSTGFCFVLRLPSLLRALAEEMQTGLQGQSPFPPLPYGGF